MKYFSIDEDRNLKVREEPITQDDFAMVNQGTLDIYQIEVLAGGALVIRRADVTENEVGHEEDEQEEDTEVEFEYDVQWVLQG